MATNCGGGHAVRSHRMYDRRPEPDELEEKNSALESMSSVNRGGFKRSQRPLPDEGPYRSFVGNLPNDTIQGDFDSLFDKLQIVSINMMRDRETDHFKGFAYVEFASREDLQKALLLDGADFDGHIVRVDVAEDKRGKRDGGGHRGGMGGGNRGGDRDRGGRGGFGNRNGGSSGHRNTFASGNIRSHGPTSDDGFQKVERGTGFGVKRGGPSNIHSKDAGRGPPRSTIPLTSDPNRPKLNLAPRITDPVELERRRLKDEEERKARLEKICSVKKN